MPLNFIQSRRGNDLLVYDGFVYTKEKISLDKIIWRCVEYDKHQCSGRYHTSDGEVIKIMGQHNHVVDAADIEVRDVILEIKDSASTTQATTN